jgi:dienelactone hydrolase
MIVTLTLRWIKPRNRQFTSSTLAMLGIMTVLHLFFDRPRWEMIPAYLMGVVAAWIMSRDLSRVSGAKAGESARWAKIPSAGERAVGGLILAVSAAVAIAIPAWAFPRINLPRPDGLYHVGRVDVALSDSSRQLTSGAPRPILVSAWYPAEAPNGSTLRYHPEPGALGAYLASGYPLPGFTYRNLAAARTHSTAQPRFSIREGRSPLVVVVHDTGASRMEGTAMFERLASRGYVVVSIDHLGSAAGPTAVEGERQTTPIPESDRDPGRAIESRVADVRFVLDRMNALPLGSPIDSLAGHIRLDRVGVVGTGLGAAAAAELAVLDGRVSAGVGIAPDTIGSAGARGVRRPFLMFTVEDPGALLDDVFRYGGTEVRLEGASTRALRDVALVGAPVVQMRGIESADTPADVHAAVSALTLRFLDQYLKERTEQTEVDLPARVQVRIIPHQAR